MQLLNIESKITITLLTWLSNFSEDFTVVYVK